MASIKWIKLDVSIFDDDKVKIILSMPEGKAMLIVWLKLLCLAGKLNNSGVFLVNGTMPYTAEMLAAVLGETQQTMTLATNTFKSLGMVDINEDILFLPNWEKHQSEEKMRIIREQTSARVALYREKQRLLTTGNAGCNEDCNAPCNADETQEKRTSNAQETQQTQTQTKTKKENKNDVVEAPATPATDMPFGLTDDEIGASLGRLNRVDQAATDLGLPFKQVDMVRAESMMTEYGEEWLLKAMDRAGIREHRSWGTVIGILKSWKSKGGIDDAFEPVGTSDWKDRQGKPGRPGADPGSNPGNSRKDDGAGKADNRKRLEAIRL